MPSKRFAAVFPDVLFRLLYLPVPQLESFPGNSAVRDLNIIPAILPEDKLTFLHCHNTNGVAADISQCALYCYGFLSS